MTDHTEDEEMGSLEFFLGNWRVCRQDVRASHPVRKDQRFEIIRVSDTEVRFEFEEGFGDGCWSQHIQNGRLENGHIRAPVVDDGKCKPAPKTDTLLIEEDTANRVEGRRNIVCRVFSERSLERPMFGLAEEAGEFGADDK
ncbi:MAG: hypothetical protein GY719_34895 [bacterium]|nr:hypothetical protein [bacterium]